MPPTPICLRAVTIPRLLLGSAIAGLTVVACHATPAPRPARPPVSPPTVPTFQRGIAPYPAPPLPPIPLVEGPLAPHVAYPKDNTFIGVDSNFIFGTVGNGHATLTVNGAPVPVAPNGEWVAFLPVPQDSAPKYHLVARLQTDSAVLDVPIRVPSPRAVLALTGPLVVDSGSVSPAGGGLALRDTESVRVSVRAPANASVRLETADHARVPLVNVEGSYFATDVPARQLRGPATLVVTRGSDTVRLPLGTVAAPDTVARYVMLGDTLMQRDTDAVIIGRSTPSGTYKWMLIPGTIAEQTGRVGDNVRVRLDSRLEVWVDSENVHPLAPGYPSPHRVVGAMAFVPDTGWVDLVMPESSPSPFLIEQDMTHLTLTLYNTEATPDIIKYLGNDSLVRVINWVPVSSDRVRLDMELSEQPYGYLMMFDPQRGLVLRLRRAPRIDPGAPLRGLTITVDAGHPPGGAIGPSGLTEPEAVLPVAFKLRDILQQRGAKVVMTRTTMDPVDLHLRTVIARRSNSHALVSIHLNAFGPGVDPFPNVGTSTLFFHPQTEPLARLVQQSLMNQLGLRDLGIHYQNIAIGRTTWMPSLITEGAFMMIPEQENLVRTEEGQERYARGIADGLEAYFRSLALARMGR